MKKEKNNQINDVQIIAPANDLTQGQVAAGLSGAEPHQSHSIS